MLYSYTIIMLYSYAIIMLYILYRNVEMDVNIDDEYYAELEKVMKFVS